MKSKPISVKKNRLLAQDRPRGPLHLGHYFGSLENRVRLQNQGYESFIVIADYQALADRLNTENIQENIKQLVRDYIAVGLDPSKSTFFIQSQIPEVAELTLIFSMLVTVNRLSRSILKKEARRAKLGSNLSVGMFSYPVFQAANILLFMPDVVPIGEDQLPHIELTREIAQKFNNTYENIFPLPEPLLGRSPRLIGLDGIEKMSKDEGNAIFLSDSDDDIRKKIMVARTDSGREIRYDPDEKPFVSHLMDLYEAITKISIRRIENMYVGKGYKELKEKLGEEVINFVKPIREKRGGLTDSFISSVLRSGTEGAKEEASKNMAIIKKVIKMNYGL